MFFVFHFARELLIQAFVSKADTGRLQTTPDDSVCSRYRMNPDDSERLRTTRNDFERFRTTPDDSEFARLRLRTTPNDSERLRTAPDDADQTYLPDRSVDSEFIGVGSESTPDLCQLYPSLVCTTYSLP